MRDEPERLDSLLASRQAGVNQADVDEALERLGKRVNDSSLLARAMETAETMMDRGQHRALKAYLKSMLAQPSRLRNDLSKCRCERGWRFHHDGSVSPCPRCAPGKHARFGEKALDHPVLGSRHHLSHEDNPKRCDECRRLSGMAEDTEDPTGWVN